MDVQSVPQVLSTLWSELVLDRHVKLAPLFLPQHVSFLFLVAVPTLIPCPVSQPSVLSLFSLPFSLGCFIFIGERGCMRCMERFFSQWSVCRSSYLGDHLFCCFGGYFLRLRLLQNNMSSLKSLKIALFKRLFTQELKLSLYSLKNKFCFFFFFTEIIQHFSDLQRSPNLPLQTYIYL